MSFVLFPFAPFPFTPSGHDRLPIPEPGSARCFYMFKFFPYKDCQVLAHRGLYNCYAFLTMAVHLPYNVKCQKVNVVVNACYINKAEQRTLV